MDDPEHLATLRKERSDLAVGPARDDGLAVGHQGDEVAFSGGVVLVTYQVDAKEFSAGHRPNSDLVTAGGREDFAVVLRESQGVHLKEVTLHEDRGGLKGVRFSDTPNAAFV